MILSDVAAERAVLAGICRYGNEAYYDVADLVNTDSFTENSNSILYSCIKNILDKNEENKIDVPSILSSAKSLGIEDFLQDKNEINHLGAVLKFPVLLPNVRKFAAKIRKLQISRLMVDQLESAKQQYFTLTGDEPISHILGLAETSIFDFTSLLNDQDDSPELLFGDLEQTLIDRAENPVDQVGIPTGFTKYDFAIGGGLRKGTVNIIGARTKVGKSLIGLNMGASIAKSNIPVLYMDTEMTKTDQQTRGAAMLSYIEDNKATINEIETGQFAVSDYKKEEILKMAKSNQKLPFYHKNIGGRSFEDQLSIMRRWLAKVVGLNDQGKAKDCVIIYDYVKLMDSAELKGDMKEYQLLGFMMTALHNFSLRYEVPILGFVQLNRDGITKESTDAASGSDRIIWLCSNFTIYKVKSDEEIAKDGIKNGNRKLVPIIARHGEGLESGDYINVTMHGKYAKLIEGDTAYEIQDKADNDDHEETEEIQYDF